MTDNGICIIPNCGREIKPPGKERGARGLCKNCYIIASNSVKDGLVTREQLVEMGLMLPRDPSYGSGPRSAFRLALKARLEGK